MANIELDGANKKIKVDSGDLTLDVPGDIILDADGADLVFADGGTNILKVTNSSSDVVLQPQVDAKDIIFKQYDGTTVATVEDNGTFNVPTSKLAINGTAITSTAAELNILDGVTSTASELNLLDGGTSVGSSITLADADGFIVNDGGTMKTIPASDISTYAGGGFTVLTSSYSSTDTSGGVLSFPSFVHADYDHYKVIGFCVPANDNVDFWLRPRNASGHYDTSNQFYYEYLARYRSSGGAGAYDNGSWQDNKWKIADNVNSDSDSNFVAFNIDLYEWGTHNTSRLAFGGTSFHHQHSDGMKTVNMGGSLHTNIDATGLDFLFSGGEIDKHGITIYGVNKA